MEALQTGFRDVRRRIGDSARTVSQALEETRATIDTLGQLETRARAVEKLVDAVAMIAVQTNMLAVSGAVEAARAGERGRGLRQCLGRHPQPGPGRRGQRR